MPNLFNNKLLIFIFLIFCTQIATSQFYTKTQLSAIHNTKSANEGDMYLDTLNKNYFIGITTGELTTIDYMDSISFFNDTLKIFYGDSIFSTPLKSFNGPWRNSNNTLATDASTSINYLLGNIGIGTNLPQEKLDVAGDIIVSDSIKMTRHVPYYKGNHLFVVIKEGQGSLETFSVSDLRKLMNTLGCNSSIGASVNVSSTTPNNITLITNFGGVNTGIAFIEIDFFYKLLFQTCIFRMSC